MLTTNALATNWRVVVKAYTTSGPNTGSSVIGVLENVGALDAFDYAIHAQGYFRHAIQEMYVSSISIDVFENRRAIETIDITRD